MFYNTFNKSIAALTTALLVTIAGTVQADAFDETRFYLGGELSVLNYTRYNNGSSSDLNKFKTANDASKLAIQKNKVGVNVFLGARFTQSIGGEIGFGLIANAKANVQNGQQASNKISNVYADILGYLPIAYKVDLVGSLGVGGLKSRADVTNTSFNNLSSLNKVKVGYRVGLGAQYNFDDNWSARGIVRYQSGNKDFLKSDTSVSLGVLYLF